MCTCHHARDRGLSGLATAALRHEHDLILRGLDLLERAGRRLAAGGRIDEPAFRALVGLLRTLADQCHHTKEEGFLFPALRAAGVPSDGPVAAVLAEHAEGRDYLATLSGVRPTAERAAAALLCASLLRRHVERENAVLFPLADRVLDPDGQARLAAEYAAMEVQAFGPGLHERVAAQLDQLAPHFLP